MRFYYSKKLLKSVLDFYFYGGWTDHSQYLMKIGKNGGSGEELLILISDIARAVNKLELEEKLVVCLRHSGFLYKEICQRLRIRKKDVIDYYDEAIIKMMFYVNEGEEVK